MGPVRKARGECKPRSALYQEVTNRIIAELEAGRFPWVQPWGAAACAPGLPRNADTHRPYSGINILILWGETIAKGFPSQGWLTFNQARQAGGNVRKGEKGTTIFYAARFTPKMPAGRTGNTIGASGKASSGTTKAAKIASNAASGEPVGNSSNSDPDRSIPFLKCFTVFNVAQISGLPARCLVDLPTPPPREIIPAAENLIEVSAADFRIGGNRAFYAPVEDFVAVPPQPAFHHQIDYYRTALHELAHWTGHRTRLDRDQSGRFGSPKYAREELSAELASAYLCAALGIVPTVRHADYLGSWLDVLRTDAKAIFKAASDASKAADYLLAFEQSHASQFGVAA